MKRVWQHPDEPNTGKRYWRSLGELADTPGFRERLAEAGLHGAALRAGQWRDALPLYPGFAGRRLGSLCGKEAWALAQREQLAVLFILRHGEQLEVRATPAWPRLPKVD
mgnify:CR=1 FL=1